MWRACVPAIVAGWIVVWVAAAAPHAQVQTALRGTIQDDSGGVMPGVTVTAANLPGTSTRNAVTDGRGAYEFVQLDPGEYEVRAILPGFGARVERVTLVEGQTRVLDMVLEIALLTETITVTRTEEDRLGVPNAVSVIHRDQIQVDRRRASAAEALADIPGLFAENRHNFSLSGGVRLAIRAPLPASGMRGIQIVQDGVPLTTADGTTNPANLDLGSAGRAEVLRGPSSVLYGNSAGGVLSVQTEFPQPGRLVVQPDFQFGSDGYQRQQVKVAGTSRAIGYLVNVSRMKSDGFRDYGHFDVRQVNATVRASIAPRTELRGVFNLFDLPFQANSSTLVLADARDRPRSVRQQVIDQGLGEMNQQGQGGLTVEHRFGNGSLFRGTGWGLWRDTWNPIPGQIIQIGRVASGLRSEYLGTNTLGSRTVEWTAGVDLSSQRDDRQEFVNLGVAAAGERARQGAQQLDQFETVLSVAPFVRASVELWPRWRLTTGARYDSYAFSARDRFLANGDQSGSRNMHAISPMVGITHTVTGALNVYANLATAYQTPTTMELSNRPTAEGGFNEELDPADLTSVEVGARGVLVRARLRYEVAGYLSTLDNALVRFQRSDERTFFRNAGESTRNGFEVLLDWTPAPRIGARLAYTYQNFRFAQFLAPEGDFSGNREPGSPPHRIVLGGTYQMPLGVRSAAQLRWVDAYFADNANAFSNWSYTVVDLRFGFDRKWSRLGVRPFLGIDNLLNERYNGSIVPNSIGNRFYEPSPGRQIYVGLTIDLGAS